jgi:hypothetical protein
MMSLNKCNYSEGGRHSCCTHPYYCIFNEKRWKLEKKITELNKEYKKLDTLRTSYIVGNYVDMDYDMIICKISIIEKDIKQLNEFKQKILNMEIDGYGYGVLES